MGYQERDYYRDETGEDSFRIKTWTVRLIVITCAVALADVFTSSSGRSWLGPILSLKANAVADPKLWYQFLTYGFAHNMESLWHIAGNMIGLFIFGRLFEERYGGKELLRFYLLTIILCGVVWSLRQYFLVGSYTDAGVSTWLSCVGASGAITMLIVVGCLTNPQQTILLFFAIRTPLWLFGILVVLSDLSGATIARNLPEGWGWSTVAFDIHLTGAALGLAYWGLGLNLGRVPGGREASTFWNKIKSWFRTRPAVRIHQELDEDEDLEVAADRLLEKIAREGESSLTPHERKVLESYSRRIRNKQR